MHHCAGLNVLVMRLPLSCPMHWCSCTSAGRLLLLLFLMSCLSSTIFLKDDRLNGRQTNQRGSTWFEGSISISTSNNCCTCLQKEKEKKDGNLISGSGDDDGVGGGGKTFAKATSVSTECHCQQQCLNSLTSSHHHHHHQNCDDQLKQWCCFVQCDVLDRQ